jgi:phosphoserine aminotransferase
VLGGEAAHGMLILSPRAVERLESYTPPWPLPKIFRLTKGGKLIDGIFRGRDDQHALDARGGRLPARAGLGALGWRAQGADGPRRCQCGGRERLCETSNDWIENLATDPATRSNTSVCLKFTDARIADGAAFAKAVAKRLEAEGVALDIGAYRDAPPGLRIWCGGTVETADIEAMMPWLDWAFEAEIAALSEAA